jgi:hypothetical protein
MFGEFQFVKKLRKIIFTKFLRNSYDLGPYSQHSILFVTSEYFQQARVLDCTWTEKHSDDKHSNL